MTRVPPPTDPTLRCALGLHEAFRRLRVPSSCIYLSPDSKTRTVSVVAVPVAGDPVGAVAGPWPAGLDADALTLAWARAVSWWNSPDTPEAERAALWVPFHAALNPVPLAVAVASLRWSEPS